MKLQVVSLGFAMALVFGGAAGAQDQPLRQGHVDFLDTNDDNAVSRQEYRAYLGSAFDHLDADGSGSLDREEVGELLSDSQFATADHNGDGSVSRREFLRQGNRDHAAADTDGTGRLE